MCTHLASGCPPAGLGGAGNRAGRCLIANPGWRCLRQGSRRGPCVGEGPGSTRGSVLFTRLFRPLPDRRLKNETRVACRQMRHCGAWGRSVPSVACAGAGNWPRERDWCEGCGGRDRAVSVCCLSIILKYQYNMVDLPDFAKCGLPWRRRQLVTNICKY